MLAGGADEEAGVDLGACSAAKDIVDGLTRRVWSLLAHGGRESRQKKS